MLFKSGDGAVIDFRCPNCGSSNVYISGGGRGDHECQFTCANCPAGLDGYSLRELLSRFERSHVEGEIIRLPDSNLAKSELNMRISREGNDLGIHQPSDLEIKVDAAIGDSTAEIRDKHFKLLYEIALDQANCPGRFAIAIVNRGAVSEQYKNKLSQFLETVRGLPRFRMTVAD